MIPNLAWCFLAHLAFHIFNFVALKYNVMTEIVDVSTKTVEIERSCKVSSQLARQGLSRQASCEEDLVRTIVSLLITDCRLRLNDSLLDNKL